MSGFRIDENTAVVGHGEADFARAIEALAAWRQFELGWVELFPRQPPIDTGTTVVILIWHFGCWSLNAARVVYGVEEHDGVSSSVGFAYGTLTAHAERGEEIFQVSIDRRTGDVRYRVRAASQPRALLAKVGGGVARALQERFRHESADALRRAIASPR